MFQTTTALQQILKLRKRIRVIQGGTSAGKTIAVLLYLIDYAMSADSTSISVVAESMPNLKRGAMRDFLNIMKTHNYYKESDWNRTDSVYQFPNGSYIEFFSADEPDKMRGSRRDILFINECNNVSYSAYEQLEVRTKLLIILDFNPVSEFWVHEEVMPHNDHDFLKLTYKDNEALDPLIIQSIESKQHNTNWWRVYGLGEIGINEGQIFKDWRPIADDEFRGMIEAGHIRCERRGLDFGYTNHPSAALDIYKWNNAYILDEVLYATGLSNKQVANEIRIHEKLEPVDEQNVWHGETKVLTIADSAEPKSIAEIKKYGVRIMGAIKGPGSVNYGIQIIQDQEIYVTQRSLNIWKEQRNYLWKVDRDGKPLNIPEDAFNHLMDALRYALGDMKARNKVRFFQEKPAIFT